MGGVPCVAGESSSSIPSVVTKVYSAPQRLRMTPKICSRCAVASVSSMYIWLIGWKSGLPLLFLVTVAFTTFRLKLAPCLGAVTERKMGGGRQTVRGRGGGRLLVRGDGIEAAISRSSTMSVA